MEIEFKNKKETEIETSITDYPVGTVVKYTTDFFGTTDYFGSDADRYIGIILKTAEDNYVLYDLEDDCVYDDIDNYTVVEVLEGHFVLEN